VVKEAKPERLPVSVSAAVFIEDDKGKLLLLQQAASRKGYRWGPPAGGMHPHESPVDTAMRETKEEINVDIELIDVLGIYPTDKGGSSSGIGFVFRAKIITGEIQPNPDEIKDCRFFSATEIESLIEEDMLYKPEYNLQSIKDWLEKRSYPLEIIRPLTQGKR